MKKKFVRMVLVMICFAWAFVAAAQDYFYNNKYYASSLVVEVGALAGSMNGLTDLGGRPGRGKGFVKDLNWRTAGFCEGSFVSAIYRDRWGFRLQREWGRIASSDDLLRISDPDLVGRYGRHLSFRTFIREWQCILEVHPLFFFTYAEGRSPYCSPYLLAGVGYFAFNPQARWQGVWEDLQPLHLEGQGFREYPERRPYSLHQVDIPLGIGLKYELGALANMRLELVHRVLFTDYLDDVSTAYIDPLLFEKYLPPGPAAIARQLYSRMQELQPAYKVVPGMARGDPRNNDSFLSVDLKLSLVLRSRIHH